MNSPRTAILGYGAIGQALLEKLRTTGLSSALHYVVVRAERYEKVRLSVGPACEVTSDIPQDCEVLIECAGHEAVAQVVPDALRRGIEVAIVSTGALSNPTLAQELESAAREGNTRLHLLPGAIGGIDALAAARYSSLDKVVYRGRKPPAAWRGTLAEELINLEELTEPKIFFSGSAREAVKKFPKNANVAATVSLAGEGFDRTRVELVADPSVSTNAHELRAQGSFGVLEVNLEIEPLKSNPKTSALTVLSALRFLESKQAGIVL